MIENNNNIVFIGENNKVFTTSLKIAEVFGKRHDNVVRDIKELIVSDSELGVLNFEETPYINEQNGQTYPMYIMDRDGFTLLVMGYTGKRALEFKKAYIKAFNKMEAELKNRQPQQLSRKDLALMVIQAEEENERLMLENKQQQVIIEEKTKQLDESKEWFSIKRWAQCHHKNWRSYNWRKLKALSFEHGYKIKKIFDANYGEVNIYNKRVFEIYER